MKLGLGWRLGALFAVLFGALPIGAARADLLYVTNFGIGTIGEYNAATGAPVNAALVSGLSEPQGIALAGGDLFVGSDDAIGEYDASTGAAVNAALVSGLSDAVGIALAGADLFVVNGGIGGLATIGEYNATTGAPVNAALVSGLSNPQFIAIQATAAVPEPGTLALLGAGLAGLACCRRHRRGARS